MRLRCLTGGAPSPISSSGETRAASVPGRGGTIRRGLGGAGGRVAGVGSIAGPLPGAIRDHSRDAIALSRSAPTRSRSTLFRKWSLVFRSNSFSRTGAIPWHRRCTSSSWTTSTDRDARETVTFGLDGTTYEIDLNDKNAAALREALAAYVGHARKVSGRRRAAAAEVRGRGDQRTERRGDPRLGPRQRLRRPRPRPRLGRRAPGVRRRALTAFPIRPGALSAPGRRHSRSRAAADCPVTARVGDGLGRRARTSGPRSGRDGTAGGGRVR